MKVMRKSVYDQYTVLASTTNWSSVLDKLLRVTTKVTESYAGDILYTLSHVLDERTRQLGTATFFGFRESGVDSFSVELDAAEAWNALNNNRHLIVENEEHEVLGGNMHRDYLIRNDVASLKLRGYSDNHYQTWVLFALPDGGAALIRVEIMK